MAKNKKLKKAIAKRKKEMDKHRTKTAWRNIWVKAGILKA